ncbi:MAG: helix-turn-helix domain-containing protein [Firmicutes bacterium]|nr:helix-turn-helix domain-containing protein [Bacillota bacterium]
MSGLDRIVIRRGLVLDLAAQGLWHGRRFQPLSPVPFRILAYLAQHPNQVIPDRQLLAVGWPGEIRDAMDLYRQIYRIRKAIEPQPARPRWLLTHKNAGYLLRTRQPLTLKRGDRRPRGPDSVA